MITVFTASNLFADLTDRLAVGPSVLLGEQGPLFCADGVSRLYFLKRFINHSFFVDVPCGSVPGRPLRLDTREDGM